MDLPATTPRRFPAMVVLSSGGIKGDSATIACPKGRLSRTLQGLDFSRTRTSETALPEVHRGGRFVILFFAPVSGSDRLEVLVASLVEDETDG